MYFDTFFINRIDTVDRIVRWADNNMDGVWHADPNLDQEADIFYDTFFIDYSPPYGFCSDQACKGPPVQASSFVHIDPEDFPKRPRLRIRAPVLTGSNVFS